MAHILIVATNAADRAAWTRLCRADGHHVSQAADTPSLPEMRAPRFPDLVLLDLDLPRGQGWRLLGELGRHAPAARVVAHTATATVNDAVAAMRAGACHFLERPVSPAGLVATLAEALAAGGASPGEGQDEEPDKGPAGSLGEGLGAMIGRSPAMQRVFEQLRRVASTPSTTTLVTGESGVGKEMVARAIHDHSARCAGPFVAVNCAALADTLVEAELFGYEPGAFTGGNPKGRTGLIAAAEGGTLLLDEIGEMASQLQAKLLRVLQERCYRRIGGSHDIPMDARIIASTNRDLLTMVEQGAFREDLYYRLNVLSIQVPPLRERQGDVPHLARRFLEEISLGLSKELRGYAPGAMERLTSSPWVGNVRELKNTIERAAIFAEGAHLEEGDLFGPEGARGSQALDDGTGTPQACSLPLESLRLRDVEQQLIEHVLAEVDGNRSRAARELGINRTTLYNKLRSYGIAS